MELSMKILAFVLAASLTMTDAYCFEDVDGCFTDIQCKEFYEDVKNVCKYLVDFESIYGSLNIQCTRNCSRKLKSILKEYPKLMTCKCQDSKCMVIKERVRACVEGSISSRKRPNIKRRSCSKRFNRCDRNDECREIFEEVPRECNSMLNNEKCTKGCEKALTNFFDHPSARKIPNCVCDGTQYFEGTCLMIRHRIQTMCESSTFAKYIQSKGIIINTEYKRKRN